MNKNYKIDYKTSTTIRKKEKKDENIYHLK